MGKLIGSLTGSTKAAKQAAAAQRAAADMAKFKPYDVDEFNFRYDISNR